MEKRARVFKKIKRKITAFDKVETFFNTDENQEGPVQKRDFYHPTKKLRYAATLIQHHHANPEANIQYDRMRIDFSSEDDRDDFYKAIVKRISPPTSRITALGGQMKNVLVIDALPTEKIHESVLRSLEHGTLQW